MSKEGKQQCEAKREKDPVADMEDGIMKSKQN